MPKLTVTMADSRGRLTRRTFEIVTKPTLVDYTTLATAFIADLQAVTDLGVIRCDLMLDAFVPGFAATDPSNVDVGATFSGYIYDGNGKKASLKIPGIKNAKVAGDGTVPLVDADVADLLNYWVDATPYELLISDGEHIDSWIRGTLDK